MTMFSPSFDTHISGAGLLDADQESQYEYADRIISASRRKLGNNDLLGAVDYFTKNIKERKYTDGDVMYQIAYYVEQLRNLVNMYSIQQANTYNGYNEGNFFRGFDNSKRVIELNCIMVAYCMVVAENGSINAQEMLQRLQMQSQAVNGIGSGYNNG